MQGGVVVHVCRGREWRGGERQVRLLIETLATRSGLLQHLVAGRDTALAGAMPPEGLAIHHVPWTAALDPRAGLALFRMLRRLHRTHGRDLLVHTHDSHALALAAAAARPLRIPLVATRRSVMAPSRLWRRPTRVIALSPAVARELAAAGVPSDRVVCIPSAVSLAELDKASHQRPALPEALPRPLVVAVGALTPEKGHLALIEALPRVLAAVPAVHLVFIGEGPERARLEARARQLGLLARVRFLGARASAGVFIRQAQVLAQPSVHEALGTAVLEAMALGVPVVATATGGLVDLLRGGAGLLVPPGNTDALADALGRVLTDAVLRSALVYEARARVSQYDAPQLADRVAEVYRSALLSP
jgi:glycosyltransferase involved in cell wall biosynthesis